MPLSTKEKSRLDELEAKYGEKLAPDLSPKEQRRLQELEEKYGSAGDSKFRTVAEQALNTLSFGYVPEVSAALTKPAIGLVNIKRKMFGEPELVNPDYVEQRDAIARDEETRKELNPISAKIGTGVGLGLGLVTPGLSAAKAIKPGLMGTELAAQGTKALATAAPEMVKRGLVKASLGSAGAGAGYGLLMNPGREEGVVDPIQAGQRAANTVVGAGLGALMPVAGKAIGGTGKAIAESRPMNFVVDTLKKYGYDKAMKALGPMWSSSKKILQSPERRQSIGKTAQDEGLVGVLPKSYEKIADLAEQATERAGKEYGNFIDQLGAKSEQMASKMTSRGEKNLVTPGMGPQVGEKTKVGLDRSSIIQKLKSKFRNDPDIPFEGKTQEVYNDLIGQFEKGDQIINISKAQKIKNSIGEKINWKRRPGDDIPPAEQVYREIYWALDQGIDDTAEVMSKEFGLTNRFAPLKTRFSNLKEASRIANEKAGRESANRFMSMSDMQVAQAGSISKGGNLLEKGIAGIGLGLANKALRLFGNQPQSKALVGAAKMIEATPALMQKYGPELQKLIDKDPNKAAALLMRVYQEAR